MALKLSVITLCTSELTIPSLLADWLTVPPGVSAKWITESEAPVGVSVAATFLRQRYPGLRFEIYLDLPSYRLNKLLKQTKPVLSSSWKAYAADPVVASDSQCKLLQYRR